MHQGLCLVSLDLHIVVNPGLGLVGMGPAVDFNKAVFGQLVKSQTKLTSNKSKHGVPLLYIYNYVYI